MHNDRQKLPYCELSAINIVLGPSKYRFVSVYRPPTRRADAQHGAQELVILRSYALLNGP